jgi:hypothetical protein
VFVIEENEEKNVEAVLLYLLENIMARVRWLVWLRK